MNEGRKGIAGGLNPMQQRFVAEYIKCSNGSQAARLAGYSPKSAGELSNQLLKHPKIKEEIAKNRKKIEDEGIYGLKKAMQETEEGMKFARETENATALASILQLRAKLNGLVIEKMDHRLSGNVAFHFEGIDNSRAVGPALEQTVVTGLIEASVAKAEDIE